MGTVLKRHDTARHDKHFVLCNGDNIFLMPRFEHLMMDNSLLMVEIPSDYYNANKEAIDSMASDTIDYINKLEI
jgi:uncharacterized protein YyaL (SSP411 family)